MLIRVLTEAVEAAGVDRSQWLLAAKFDARRLEDSNGRVEVGEYARLQVVALELSGDPALGLHLGEASNTAAADRMGAEFAIAGFLRMIRQFTGPKAGPRRALFQHSSPAYRSEYTRIFGGAESFDHSFTGIEFDRRLLDLPQPHVQPELYAVLELEAERRLARLTGHAGYAERTRDYLVARLLELQPDMAAVARHFGISVRTLRRRLSEEGITYAGLIEQAQAIVAKRLLGDARRSIHEAAYAMGFADPSAFHRAFKRC